MSGSPPGAAPDVPVRIRDLQWNDFDDLVATYWQLYDERAEGLSVGIPLFGERPSRADEVTWFAELAKGVLEGRRLAVVAEVGGKAVGMCEIRPVPPGPGSERAHVGDLGILVQRGHRDRGVGRALMRRAIELARSRYSVVTLGVFDDNARAIALYESLGFVKYGHLPHGFRRGDRYYGEDLMYLDLAVAAAPANR